MSPLVVTPITGLPEILPGEDLSTVVLAGVGRAGLTLQSGDIIVLAQKIVSKAEGRRQSLAGVVPSVRAIELAREAEKDPRLVEMVLRETTQVLRCRPGTIIVEDRRGLVLANAGIDASNIGPTDGDAVLLLPEDPDASAAGIRAALQERTGADIGVMIIDSLGRAWRLGTIGTAIGIAGMPGLIDLRGRPDRDGRQLRTSELGAADELAAAASLMMGQDAQGVPVAHVRGFPHPLRDGSATELKRPRQMDLFR